MKLPVIKCGNCGHEVPVSDNLDGLKFEWLGPLTSRLQCTVCGVITLQRAYDASFTHGEFLTIRPYIDDGKGRYKYGRTRKTIEPKSE